jgi:hypothetical protein
LVELVPLDPGGILLSGHFAAWLPCSNLHNAVNNCAIYARNRLRPTTTRLSAKAAAKR